MSARTCDSMIAPGATNDPCGWARLALLALPVLLALFARGSHALEMHGKSDAFAGDGVRIAWAVLRGPSEDLAYVVLRVAADPGRFAQVAADGVDPFANQRKSLVPTRTLTGSTDLSIPRRSFADFPRTEVLFYNNKSRTRRAELIVYYLGVPDTTPEFTTEAALNAYLTERMAGLAAGTKGK